jgi:hypothetical protein
MEDFDISPMYGKSICVPLGFGFILSLTAAFSIMLVIWASNLASKGTSIQFSEIAARVTTKKRYCEEDATHGYCNTKTMKASPSLKLQSPYSNTILQDRTMQVFKFLN